MPSHNNQQSASTAIPWTAHTGALPTETACDLLVVVIEHTADGPEVLQTARMLSYERALGFATSAASAYTGPRTAAILRREAAGWRILRLSGRICSTEALLIAATDWEAVRFSSLEESL